MFLKIMSSTAQKQPLSQVHHNLGRTESDDFTSQQFFPSIISISNFKFTYVHSHTTNFRPAVPLSLVFMVSAPSF